MTEKLDIGLKNTQNKEDVEKDKKRDAKIEHLNLSPEDKNKLDAVVRGIDAFERGPAEQMTQAFLGIKEAFKFSEERVKIIKREVVGGFTERQLEKLDFPAEQKDEILKIIMGEKEEEVKEAAKEREKIPSQKLFEKSYEQLIKQKVYFLEILDRLEFDKKKRDDMAFFHNTAEEIFKILGIDKKEGIRFPSTEIDNIIIDYFSKKVELMQELRVADDKKFIDDFERYRDEITKFVKGWNDFSQTLLRTGINRLSEFNFLFSFFEREKKTPEFTEKASEKLVSLLAHFGFRQIYPKKGEEYDPRYHLADDEIVEVGLRRGQVAKVMRIGLIKGTEVVQKARVIVGK